MCVYVDRVRDTTTKLLLCEIYIYIYMYIYIYIIYVYIYIYIYIYASCPSNDADEQYIANKTNNI